MNNDSIRRYARDLKGAVRGFRLRKGLAAKFQASLAPLLEDLPDPSYEDLVEAFGPPEHMAESLLHTMEQPRPVSLGKKLALGACAVLVVGLVGFGAVSLGDAPETGEVLLDAAPYTGPIDDHRYFAVDDPFTHSDSHWDQPRGMAAYQVEVQNTNDVPTSVSVYCGDRQDPNTFTVPAGQTQVFVVNDPQPGDHRVAFDSPNGSLSGTVRVLLSEVGA